MVRGVPAERIRRLNSAPVRGDGQWVVYWMVAARRLGWSFALDRAIEHAVDLQRPLVILEALRCDYPWASDRLHGFVLDGMADSSDRCRNAPVLYHPYVEPERGAGSGLLEALAAPAAVVVTDDFPTFFLPRMVSAAASRLPVRVEAVDGNGLLPLAATERDYPTAHAFRRFLQSSLPAHLARSPQPDPLRHPGLAAAPALPGDIARRWPAASTELLGGGSAALARLPIDHRVPPAPLRGGNEAAERTLHRFVTERLPRYAERRNDVEDGAASGLSPYLHFGHISAHQVFASVMDREGWTAADLSGRCDGRRSGWWGLSEPAEAFLDQLITWRELGFVTCRHRSDHAAYESLPGWALATLAKHAGDTRARLYDLAALEGAATHDEIWNAAQTQLRRDGTIHNYLRMLWGKKILEWTSEPREALEVMIELNNRLALDGRDPNSYSGIFWVLGRYDRGWGPERPVFGTVRYMSSASTARKLDLRSYLERFA